MQPLDGVEDAVVGHRDARGAGQHRPRVFTTRRSIGKTRVMYQPSTSGSASNRSVSAVGAQSTTITSHCPERACSRSSRARAPPRGPGTPSSSSASTGSTPATSKTVEEVGLDVGPRLLEPLLGVDLLSPEPVGHRRGRGRAMSNASASECAGSVESTSVRGRPRPRRGGGRDRGLADAALPGEEQDPHEVASTRFLWPLSAVSMRIFSPLRLSIPINGIETSRASR